MSEFSVMGLRAMIDEVGCPIPGKRLAPENDRADGSGLSIIDKDTHHIAARIAQKLRGAGFECAIVIQRQFRRHVILRTPNVKRATHQ